MSESYISKNVEQIEISGIRKFYNKVVQFPDAISLTLGQPDFNTPKAIKDAMIKAIEENKTFYTSNAGVLDLREEISKYLKTLDINYNPEEVCVTVGGSEALVDVFTALINPGDSVLIPTPAYPAYESCVKLLGGNIINYHLKDDFGLNVDEIENIIKEKNPKVIVVSFPSNPTGAIMTKEDRDKLYKIINENEIVVVTDEMYSSLCFHEEYYSISQFEDIKDKVIYINGFSKMFSMTGLRLGYLCAVDKFMKHIMKVHQYNVTCAPSIVQFAAAEGLRSAMDDVEYMKGEFIKRRDYLYNEFVKLGFEVNMPNGAFYMFPSIKKFNITSEEFCERLLKEGKVAVVPGSAFGIGGEGYIRISYAYSMEQLEEAMSRIKKWLETAFV